ncbi:MAG: FAD-dependent oxidoreductase [Clostridiales bacterium]|nr:FAD-dependent oxidoreductase [Clostridiales bacterium]
MADYETQIVVIAGGPAGLCAAVQAAEDGAEVILIEKNAAVGGAANMGMGPLAIGSHYQKRQMYDITVEKALNMIMEYTHYNIDGRLVKRYFEQSAETIEWLEEMGVEFEGAYKYFTKSEPTWHIVKTDQGIGPRAASFMNKALYAKAQELGVQVLLQTAGKKILKDEDGKVCGVLATDKDGNEIEIACKAAIICTGGAGANPKTIKEETGYTFGKDLFNFAIPGNVGDGIRMAWEAGADHVPVRIEQAANFEGIDDLPQSVPNIMMQPNLLVNLQGKRVMNEEQMQNTTFLGNAASHQKHRVLFSIVDSSIVKYYIRNGVDEISMVRFNPDVSDFTEGVRIAQETGNSGLFVADSLEELAEKTGIDEENLLETVEEYNDYCDSVDEEFFKRKEYLRPLTKAPYYAAAIRPGGYGTVGGIRINENCEACDSEFDPIPGLYAAGADACNIYDDSYMFLLPGNSMGFAVNTGRIAGMEAAEYVEDED